MSGSLPHASLYAVFAAPTGPAPAPTVVSVAPAAANASGAVALTVDGTGFQPGAGFAIARPGSGAGAWTATGSMAAVRRLHATVPLPGGKALAFGGYDGHVSLASAEVYDPAPGTWSATGAMAAARTQPIVTVLHDGRVMATGGYTAGQFSSTFLASAETYDAASGAWTTVAPMSTPRVLHAVVTLADGRVLAAGGSYNGTALTSAEIFDPATGAWTATGSLGTGRYGHTATLLGDGKVLVAGGIRSGVYLTSAEIFDPATGLWTAAPAMANRRYGATATLLGNGKVLVAGGYDGTANGATAELYDPATGVWQSAPSMSQGRWQATATLLQDGRVLEAGTGSTVELYDPAANAWTVAAPLPSNYYQPAAAALASGQVLLDGGEVSADPPSNGALIYSPPSLLTVAASNVAFQSATRLTGTLDLTGRATGAWSVVVVNPDAQTGTKADAFLIQNGTPPQAVTDLAVAEVDASSAALSWTAPAPAAGSVASYDLRYATAPIDAESFAAALPAAAPGPGAPGTAQAAVVTGFTGASFYAALKSVDLAGNVSALSDVASFARSAATADGEPELVFSARQPVFAVPVATDSATGAAMLSSAAAQGLRPVAGLYQLGSSSAAFSPAALLRLHYSTGALAALGAPASAVSAYGVSGGWLTALSSQTPSAASRSVDAPLSALPATPVVGLFARLAAPAVAAIVPNSGRNDAPLAVAVDGTGFQPGAALSLTRAGAAGGAWTATGSMAAVRRLHATTPLPGGKALAFGGYDGHVSLASAEVYDPASGAWTATAPMATPRTQPLVTVLRDGRVMATGGYVAWQSSSTFLAGAEVYDPAAGTWTTVAPMSTPRVLHALVTLADGRVLAVGGSPSNGVGLTGAEIFDPATGAWTPTGSLATGRYGHTATLLGSGKVLVTGGYNGTYQTSAEIFDPATGLWTAAPAMANRRYIATATLLGNGKVLVAGGYDGTANGATAELYDPATG
ncbi:MAG: hypothetical protein HY079_05675, partial [Elusimicrobia bacterium]|nr:hypothetical protein [Elusimicrobiota bacterium]